jgi:hypothetical protein
VGIYSLLCDYSSFVVVSERKGVKQSSYLGVAYVSFSSLGSLNKNLFYSVITFLDCFVAMLLAMTGRLGTLLRVIASCRLMLFAVMDGR